MRRIAPIWALLLVACTGGGSRGAAAPAAAAGPLVPAFEDMRRVLSSSASDPRANGGRIVDTGITLLRAPLPHDVGRARVPVFLAGRAEFGDRLKAFADALERPDEPTLLRAFDDLAGAFSGWVNAYHGLPLERSV